MDLPTYEKCCRMYARFLISDHKTPELELTAAEAFMEAYVLSLDAGIKQQVLKNTFRDILSATREEYKELS